MEVDKFIEEVKSGTNDGYSIEAFHYCNINCDSGAKRDMARDLQQWQGWSGSEVNRAINTLEYVDPDCEYCMQHKNSGNSDAYDTLSDVLGDDTDCLLYSNFI